MFKNLLFCFLIVFIITIGLSSKILAQENSSLNGYITDLTTKETLISASVSLKGTKYGAYTNKSGYFSIKNIPPGNYQINISYIGYEKINEKITLLKGKNIRKDFALKLSNTNSKEVTIYADREDEKRQISISKVNIPVSQLKEIRIGGESDIFRSLQMLPGILTSSQISSGLYIRGGSPDQNLVLVDGSAVYNPSHLFGFISTFNADAIKDVELIKGGFPAEYGGRLSAVLNITQKDGNKEKFEGLASVGAISSRLSFEGPLGNGSFYIGGRRTYLELLKALVPEDRENPLPDFNFYDVNAKINQSFGSNDKVFLSAFRSKDHLNYSAFGLGIDLNIANTLGALRWTHIFDESLFSTLSVSGSEYENGFTGDNSGYKVLVANSINDLTVKGNFEWLVNEQFTSKFGFEINKYEFKYLTNFANSDSIPEGSGNGTTNFTVKDYSFNSFAQFNYQINEDFSIQSGWRLSYWQFINRVTSDPRFAFRYQALPNLAVKAAWGIYHQNLKLATQPDFSFFDTWLGTDSTLELGRSQHYIISFETNPVENYDLNLDVYYKTLENINELNRNALKIGTGKDALYQGNGESFGFELFLQKRIGKFTGWAGYGFGIINATFDSLNGGKTFHPKYDRRHDFKIVGQYNIDDTWDAGANFTFQTGQPYTGATSQFQSILPEQTYGSRKVFMSDRYGLRLTPSHQLNINGSYKFTMFGLPAKVVLDIYNVYSRRDIWFRYYDTSGAKAEVTDVKLLPIIPTFSLEVKF
jgi:hypothetical protein